MPVDDKQAGSGAPDAGGGAEGNTEGQDNSTKREPANRINEADHRRAVDDANRYKKEAADAKAALKAKQDEELKTSQKWEEYAKNLEKERDQEKDGRNKTESLFKNTLKSGKVAELAIKAGLKNEARDDLDSLNIDDVEIEETSSGRYLVRDADKFVEKLKKSKPHWFNEAKPPAFNGGGGKSGGGNEASGPATMKDVAEAERKFGKNSPQFKDTYNKWVKQKTGAK